MGREGQPGIARECAATTDEVPARVLVVDDQAANLQVLGTMLGQEGYEVVPASDGPTALTVAAEFRPDIVLCDIGLPLMDGYQVVDNLRRRPEFAATYFVALSGYGREQDVQRSFAAGFHDHIVKPIDLARLEATLSRSE